jgi:acyl-coenzyme A thioesterase PaaI-like protein
MVSVNLSTDFLGAVKVGDWLEAHVEVRKHGARLSFAECQLRVGDRVMLRCSGVFAVVGPALVNKEVPEG